MGCLTFGLGSLFFCIRELLYLSYFFGWRCSSFPSTRRGGLTENKTIASQAFVYTFALQASLRQKSDISTALHQRNAGIDSLRSSFPSTRRGGLTENKTIASQAFVYTFALQASLRRGTKTKKRCLSTSSCFL